MPGLATSQQINDFLQQHPAWRLEQGKLMREFLFDDFIGAFGFMTRVALVAERAGHHPEWCNVYKRVEVSLITHEAGAVTERDFDLARQMDALYER